MQEKNLEIIIPYMCCHFSIYSVFHAKQQRWSKSQPVLYKDDERTEWFVG